MMGWYRLRFEFGKEEWQLRSCCVAAQILQDEVGTSDAEELAQCRKCTCYTCVEGTKVCERAKRTGESSTRTGEGRTV